MASEERKVADEQIQKDNFFKSLSAAEKQAETDAFQCSRCKQVSDELFIYFAFMFTSFSANVSIVNNKHGALMNQ